ncbi:MAG: hypothetical protein EYC70_17015 [Planctomycetota bacterium]|nr:MAG: hypothetical protein EYC70_17015 [Planctomycetota bacterium]
MLRRIAPLVLGLAACAPMPPSELAELDRAMFGSYRHGNGRLDVPIGHDGRVNAALVLHRDGIEHRDGSFEIETLPALEQAWRSGRVPRYGVVGHAGGARLRSLAVETRLDETGGMHVYAVARALHPFPFTMQFEARAGAETRAIGTARAQRWGPGMYHAHLEQEITDQRLEWDGMEATITEDGSGQTSARSVAIRPVW